VLAVAARSPSPRRPRRRASSSAGRPSTPTRALACHGPVAFAVKPPPRNLAKDPFKGGDSVEQIYATITNGLPNTRMVGYPQIKPADRWVEAHYLREFRKRR
jgi:hypothetical protein